MVLWGQACKPAFYFLNISQLMTMTQTCPVTAIAWSPTRSGLLATLGKESPVVQLYDIQHASVGKFHSQVVEFYYSNFKFPLDSGV